MTWAAAVANGLWLAGNLPAHSRFRQALNAPARQQADWLARQCRAQAGSTFGRVYGLEGVTSYAEFTQRVPLATYAEVEPWVRRIQAGEAGVLTSDPVTHLVPTSGSSGARKLIPFTAGLQAGFNAAVGAWITELARSFPGVMGGPAYWAISPAVSFAQENSAVPIGFDDDRAYLGGLRRRLVGAVMAVPGKVRCLHEQPTWRYATLLSLLRQPELRLISVWHPSFLHLLLGAAATHWDELCTDVERGTCAVAPMAWLRARPMRARADALRRAGAGAWAAWWPRLGVISAWAAGGAHVDFERLAAAFPTASLQPKGLLATEAAVTLPWRGGAQPLALTSGFFEFLDEEGRVHRAHELRRGICYEVVVTNGGGLWRYRLGDLVEVDGLVAATPSLRWRGRAGNVSDWRGEKISEDFVAQVLGGLWTACQNGPPSFSMVAVEPVGADQETAPPAYVLFVAGSAACATGLAARFEQALLANPHYAVCRRLGQLGPARVFAIGGNGYEAYVNAEVARGRRLGDVKAPVLARRSGWTAVFSGAFVDAGERQP